MSSPIKISSGHDRTFRLKALTVIDLALGGAELHPQITQMSFALMVGNAVIQTNPHAQIGDA